MGAGPLEPRVAGSILANAVHDIDLVAISDREHLRNDLGRILEVGIQGHHIGAARMVQARGDRGLVPGVGPQPKHPELGPLAAESLEEHGRGIRRTVIDCHDFVGPPPAIGQWPQSLNEDGQHRLLVEHRNHDADGDVGARQSS